MKTFATMSLMVLGVVLNGCGVLRGSGDPQVEAPQIRLTVENDLIPPLVLSIYATPRTGGRSFVGNAPSGEATTFTLDRSTALDYRFVAQTNSGEELTSDVITLGGGDTAIWNIRNNVIIRSDAPDPINN